MVISLYFIFFNRMSSTVVYTLSLHDALPISCRSSSARTVSTDPRPRACQAGRSERDRKSTRLNSSHVAISYAVFCLKKKNNNENEKTTKSDTIVRSLNHHISILESEH